MGLDIKLKIEFRIRGKLRDGNFSVSDGQLGGLSKARERHAKTEKQFSDQLSRFKGGASAPLNLSGSVDNFSILHLHC